MKIFSVIYVIFSFLTHLSFSSKIENFIPNYCMHQQYQQILNIYDLRTDGYNSTAIISGNLHDLRKLPDKDRVCWIIVYSPPNMGIATKVQTVSPNANFTIAFRSGSNSIKYLHSSHKNFYDEIVAKPWSEKSDIYVKILTDGDFDSDVARNFVITFTAFRNKTSDCGLDFDCGNNRCIWSSNQCNGHNNCGNNKDEEGCDSSQGIKTLSSLFLNIFFIISSIYYLK